MALHTDLPIYRTGVRLWSSDGTPINATEAPGLENPDA
jgi:hypothetical protein